MFDLDSHVVQRYIKIVQRSNLLYIRQVFYSLNVQEQLKRNVQVQGFNSKQFLVAPCVVALLCFSSAVFPSFALAQGPNLAYRGTVHNTTFNTTTTIEFTSIVQTQQKISGKVVVGPKLIGNGSFTGTVDANGNINFTDTPTDGASTIFFKGTLQTNGSLSGTYTSPNPDQRGTWQATPETTARIILGATPQVTPGIVPATTPGIAPVATPGTFSNNSCANVMPQAGAFYRVEAMQTLPSPASGIGGYLSQSGVSVPAQPLNWSSTQILAESANGKEALGMGWMVEPAAPPNGYGDVNLHLFVFTRHQGKNCLVNRNSTGWAGHFHPLVTAPLPQGVLMRTNTTHEFLFMHIQHTWLIGYDAKWIGYIDDVQWNNQFTQVAKAYWYGEVHSPNTSPRVEMGDGTCGRFGTASQVERMFLISSNGKPINASAMLLMPQNSLYYDSDKTPQSSPFSSFRYGGAGTLHQARGNCPLSTIEVVIYS